MISEEDREGGGSSVIKMLTDLSFPQYQKTDQQHHFAQPPDFHEAVGPGEGAAAGFVDRSTESREAMTLLALSHTPGEHRLYQAMLVEVVRAQTRVGTFSVRSLMTLTGLRSYSTIRRGLAGLIKKLSIEHQRVAGVPLTAERRMGVYLIFSPQEIFARRVAAGLMPYPQEMQAYQGNTAYGVAMGRVIARHDLSRREAQVALCCAEGLTNAEIGEKLYISEETVKFHLRHIFTKFRVKRRAELVSLLFRQETQYGVVTEPRA